MEKRATRDAYGEALLALGNQHDDVVVLDADLSQSTKTSLFAQAFPDRFFNAGIAEQNMIGMAAGMSTVGKVVFCSSFAMFAVGRAFEIIRNSVAYANLNVKICATHAGLTVGEDGGSHQSVADIAVMRSLPNFTVIVPADGISAGRAVELLYATPGPAYLRLGRPAVPVIYGDSLVLRRGKGILLRTGADATIIACGVMVAQSLQAADRLAGRGIEVAVVDMLFIKPVDEELIIQQAAATGALLTAEEHNIIGGLGSAVSEVCAEHLPVPISRLGINDMFGQSGKPEELLEEYGLSVARIEEKIEELLRRKQ